MATSTRTDIHRPSAPEFDPADYVLRGVFDLHPEVPGRARMELVNELVKAGYSFGRAPHGSGQCSHCGAHVRYAALMTHDKTMAIITIGEQCLDNRFSVDKAEFDALRKAAAAARAEHRLLTAFTELCEENPALVWATYAHNIGVAGAEYRTEPVYFDEPDGPTTRRLVPGTTWAERNRKDWAITTLTDLAYKARKYGSASDKQLAFAARLVDELEQAEAATAQREAKRAAERAARVNAAIGEVGDRRPFTGIVRWFDHFESSYGYTPKTCTVIILDTAEGTVKWTASNYIELERGQQLTFKATVKAHDVYEQTGEITTIVTRGKLVD